MNGPRAYRLRCTSCGLLFDDDGLVLQCPGPGQRHSGVQRRGARCHAAVAEIEGIDIEPAAGVALAALVQAGQRGLVAVTEQVHLNVTGGGRRRKRAAGHRRQVQPDLAVNVRELRDSILLRAVTQRVAKYADHLVHQD